MSYYFKLTPMGPGLIATLRGPFVKIFTKRLCGHFRQHICRETVVFRAVLHGDSDKRHKKFFRNLHKVTGRFID